jgi:hypothetical protein
MKNSLSSSKNAGGGGGFGQPSPPPSVASMTRLSDVLKDSHKQPNARRSNQRNNHQRRLNQNANYQNLLSQIECTLNESRETAQNSEIKKINRISFIELLKLIDANEFSAGSSEKPVDIFNHINDSNASDESRKLNSNSQMIISQIENDLKESMSILCQYNNGSLSEEKSPSLANDYTIVEEENEDDLGLLNSGVGLRDRFKTDTNKENLSVENKLFSNFNRNDLTRKNILASVKTADSVSKRRNSVDQIVLPGMSSAANSSRLKTSVSQFNYEAHLNDVISNGSFIRSDEKFMNENSTATDPIVDTSVESNWNYDELNELRKKFISLLSSDSASNHQLNSSCDIFSKSDEESSNKRFSLDQNTVSVNLT